MSKGTLRKAFRGVFFMSRRKRLLPTAFRKRLVKKDKSRGRRSDFRLAAAYSRKAGGI
ncbi:hypothetical protein CLOLEP_02676 [[Clostridium] leptum DSM 753]|uniref:Uncharacterized protein n=1 Tax=[Clostridium] leptum DSM 753 TaxID=428125 RepID=A7VVR4_9FIRM|nr:hypothetical protein CLOLEP_02676 [[Clostridium] leptum DSM 753]